MSFLGRVRAAFQRTNDNPSARNAVNGGAFGRTRDISAGGGPNIWPVHPDVQREIQKGPHLNMKVVVRGMRGTGKSTIVSRLCGYAPPEKYTPSPEISAGTIFYRSHAGSAKRGHSGGAKVELWDVVDEGFRATSRANATPAFAVADARSIDVYRNCHVAAFVIDRTRRETLDYALREAHHVPPTTCVLFILNFHDAPKEAHVVVSDEVDVACRNLRRTTTPMILAASAGRPPPENYSISATWVDVSATTGYGMDLLRNVFEIPYVFLSVLTLESQIYSYFQFVEQHQSWLFFEMAKRKQNESPAEKNMAALSADGSLPGAVTGIVHENCKESSLLSLNIECGGKTHECVEEDENGIAKDFFDGLDEDDTEGGDVVGPGNASSGRGGGWRENVRAGTFTDVTPPSLFVPSQSPAAFPPSSPPSPTLPPPAIVDDTLTLLGGNQHGFASDVLDVGEDQRLDDAFFESGESEREKVPVNSLALPVENSDGDDDDAPIRADAPPAARVDTPLALSGATSVSRDTSFIQADIDLLVRQMQTALGAASAGGKRASHSHRGEPRSRDPQREKRRARRSNGYHQLDDAKRSTAVDDNNTDDGTFETIRE